MLKVGITGGIGSGKSIVCRVFETLGIPVFNADDAAKHLMTTDNNIITKIKLLLGENAYKEAKPDRQYIATLVFQQPSLLQQVNQIIHPAVSEYGNNWMSKQSAPYCIKEAAIFFESGSYKEMDVMVGVYAPNDIRIQRVLDRDNTTAEKIMERIANQMDEEEKMRRCNYVINNYSTFAIIPQILNLHQKLVVDSRY